MARVKIEITGNSLGTVRLPVRITDINYGGHAGNDAIVGLLHEARMQWLGQHQFSEMNFAGASLIMSQLIVEFKREVFYGEQLTIEIFAGDITKVGFELLYQLTTIRQQTTTLIAKAITGMVCYNYQSKKMVAIPEAALSLLQA
jgi:acyl-CoA thioester hydrolase